MLEHAIYPFFLCVVKIIIKIFNSFRCFFDSIFYKRKVNLHINNMNYFFFFESQFALKVKKRMHNFFNLKGTSRVNRQWFSLTEKSTHENKVKQFTQVILILTDFQQFESVLLVYISKVFQTCTKDLKP